MTTFQQFKLPPFLLQSLEHMQIKVPSPIQTKAIPVAMEGHDLLASSQTGSGKTIAYLLPMITTLNTKQGQTALILTPTRELAIQVQDSLIQLIGKKSPLKMALLIGGQSMGQQFAQLKANPHIVVGTPGRIIDHLKRNSLKLAKTGFLVLDETDRMLDMGFSQQLDVIVKFLPSERQTLMFSATMPANIIKLAKKYLNDPQRISVDLAAQPAPKIKQKALYIKSAEKFPQLLKELNEREGSIVIFVKTKRGAEKLAKQLQAQNHNTDAIHGDLNQNKRIRAIDAFRKQKSRIMVATDIIARGLDVPHIQHVINYDLPGCAEDYTHRIGRTGRAGAHGQALTLISPDDSRKWKSILKSTGAQISA
ncbi:MAG: hypothetical protein BGO77_07350 [Caedibacter sp. 37-49]|nr:MAG: hypothetical protein BGO77_07350 [Caedibacter sp. 37-49]